MEGHSHLLPWGFSQRAQRILLLNKNNRRLGAKQAAVHIVDKVWVIGKFLLKRWSRAVWISNSPLFIRRLLQGLAFVFLYFLLASVVTPTRLDKFSWHNEWQALLTCLQFSLAVPVEARTPQKSEALLGHLGLWKCYSRYTLEGGMATQLQYSCLENPTDRGAWWATVHGSQSWTQRKWHRIHSKYKALGALQNPD